MITGNSIDVRVAKGFQVLFIFVAGAQVHPVPVDLF